MPLEFKPKTEEELKDILNFPEGGYRFVVVNAEDVIGRNNEPAIRVTMRIYDAENKFIRLTEYLKASSLFRLLHFCQSIGMENQYKNGKLDKEQIIGKEGYAYIVVENGNNKIRKYLVKK